MEATLNELPGCPDSTECLDNEELYSSTSYESDSSISYESDSDLSVCTSISSYSRSDQQDSCSVSSGSEHETSSDSYTSSSDSECFEDEATLSNNNVNETSNESSAITETSSNFSLWDASHPEESMEETVLDKLNKVYDIDEQNRNFLRQFDESPGIKKRKRGRPPRNPLFTLGGVSTVADDVPSEQKNYNPTEEEVWQEIKRLEQLHKEERAARGKKRGRPKLYEVPVSRVKEEVQCTPDMLFRVPESEPDLMNSPSKVETNFYEFAPRRKPGRPRIHFIDPHREKRKRGRPRKPRTEEDLQPKERRSRGRPRKPKTEEDLKPKEHRKRGRPCKPKTLEDLLPKIPKKRGPKPKIMHFSGSEPLDLSAKPKPKKPKIIFSYEDAEDNKEEILRMLSSGTVVVDVNDPGPSHIRRRGRPRKGFEKPKLPKGPPKKRGRKKKEIDPNELEAKAQAKVERRKARERRRQEKREREAREKEERRRLREMKRRARDEEKQVGKKKRGRRPKEDIQFGEREKQPPEQNVCFNNATELRRINCLKRSFVSLFPIFFICTVQIK
jgi:hypothetical protein